MTQILWVNHQTFRSKRSSFLRFKMVWCHQLGGGLTEIEFWAGTSILSFGESRSSVRPWHPRDYSKHMSRDDVINTSDAYHMILVYHIQPHDKSFKYSPGNFYRTNFFKLEKLYLNIIWKVKIDWKLCKIKVFVVIFRLIKHMLSIYFEKVIFN